MTLEQFCNFDVINTHGIVISEWCFYEFIGSYKNIHQLNFRGEKKELLTARLVLVFLGHGHWSKCLSSVTVKFVSDSVTMIVDIKINLTMKQLTV